jgi:hypothetical protein
MLTCTVVFVLGCNWPYLAVVKHVNKLIELIIVEMHTYFGWKARRDDMNWKT